MALRPSSSFVYHRTGNISTKKLMVCTSFLSTSPNPRQTMAVSYNSRFCGQNIHVCSSCNGLFVSKVENQVWQFVKMNSLHVSPRLSARNDFRNRVALHILHGSRTSRVQALSISTTSPESAEKSNQGYQSPTVTWGIIPHPPEASKDVIDFLKSEGIDTEELKDVELPSSVQVMQERLDFLKKIGLSLEIINSYPLMVTCSIKKNLVPVLDYLEKLGLTSKDLPSFVEKYPMVLHSSVVIDLMPVIDFLLGLDIQRKDIRKVLMRYPDVLGFRLEGTMSTSVAYLVSIGVRARCIGRMLTEYPEILGMRVANNIKPKVDFLVSYGLPKSIIAKILEVRPYMLGFELEETMMPTVNDLLEAGVERDAISGIISQYPDILGQNIKRNLTRRMKWLVEEVKVVPSDVPKIIEKLPQILFIKEGLAMERVDYLTGCGFDAHDVARMVVLCPQILALSISQALEPNLKFLLRDMKRSITDVVAFPVYFTYDLKSRIMPRYRLIAKRGIDCSLEWFLNCSDQKFKERLEAEYMDEEDLEGPVFQMGGLVYGNEEDEATLDLNSDLSDEEELELTLKAADRTKMSPPRLNGRQIPKQTNQRMEDQDEKDLDLFYTASELSDDDEDSGSSWTSGNEEEDETEAD